MREAYRAARDSAPGPTGEPARAALRARCGAWLNLATARIDEELAARSTVRSPEALLAAIADPRERLRRYDELDEEGRRVSALLDERRRVRRQAGESVEAGSVCEFLAAGHPVPVRETSRRFASGAIAPLDDAVQAGARGRRLRARIPLNEPEHPADEASLRNLADHAAAVPSSRIVAVLRRLGPVFDADPDLESGPLLVSATGPSAPTLFRTTETGHPTVILGSLHGPVGLRRGLDAFGRAVRATFLDRARGAAAWRWSDPAFSLAAGVLFGRLVDSPRFRESEGIAGPESLIADLRFETALAPRRNWTYLEVAGFSQELPSSEPDPRDVDALLGRANGRPGTIWERRLATEGDPRGAAALRGTVLALLIEERLLSRFGWDWFRERGAGRWLQEMWEAEPDTTAESLADALDLGTIEATPMIDRYRP